MRFAKIVLTGGLACGLLGVCASAQEGDIVQQEKARREKELRDRNAQTKDPHVTGAPTQGSGVDKPMAVPSAPAPAAPAVKGKRRKPGQKKTEPDQVKP